MNIKLKNARTNANLTQAQIAKEVDISVVSYQRIEYGKQAPKLSTAKRIAKALNSTVDELF